MPVESEGMSQSVSRVALLIDCENESAVHVERILQVAASIGRVVQMNAYADWANPRSKSWAEACERYGVRQVQVNRTPRGKNTVDNYISAEAARLAQRADIDAVCLVSSDSDFSGAATVVRAAGKDVYGVGSAAGAFAAACTDFFQLGKPGGGWARGQSARAEPPPMPPARSESPAAGEAAAAGGAAPAPRREREAGRAASDRQAAAGTRRCIGIDLAWGERNPTGCVELVWDGGELVLARLDLRRSLREIVEWIEPDRGGWVVAIDAPLVIRNRTGRRAAEADADRYYRRYHAGAYPSSLDKFGEGHRGDRLWRALEEHGGGLFEQLDMIGRPRLVFETYPHVVMVELFNLERTIKYKARPGRDVVAGQRQLVDAIREHLRGDAANPRLRSNDALDGLLREPPFPLSERALKDREELLDGLVGAYMAAWADAGRPLQGLGEAGYGVMITPHLRGIAPPFGQ